MIRVKDQGRGEVNQKALLCAKTRLEHVANLDEPSIRLFSAAQPAAVHLKAAAQRHLNHSLPATSERCEQNGGSLQALLHLLPDAMAPKQKRYKTPNVQRITQNAMPCQALPSPWPVAHSLPLQRFHRTAKALNSQSC